MRASRWLLLTAIVTGSFGAGAARGQGASLPFDEPNYLEKSAFGKLVSEYRGEKDKKTLETFDRFAKYYVYRITRAESLRDRERALSDLETEVVRRAVPNTGRPNHYFIRAFNPLLANYLRQVLVHYPSIKGNQTTLLYTAQMLPIAARLKIDNVDHLKEDKIGDLLVEILKQPSDKAPATEPKINRHPAIQMYAAKALRQYFPVKAIQDNLFNQVKKDQDVERVDALSGFIDQKWPAKTMDDDAVRYIRREALASLADAQMPAVAALAGFAKKGGFGVAEGTPVPTFMRVLVKGGMTPEPSLFEKYHAALGLCKLQCSEVPDYEPETGVYLVGAFVVDFAIAYNKEVNQLRLKKTATLPWKIYSERLKIELNQMVKNTKDSANANKAAAAVRSAALPLLTNIAAYDIAQPENLNALRAVVNGIRPKAEAVTLFKTVKGPTIKMEGR